MNQDATFNADALLQHEPFVRAVVRGLLADEDRVRDVVQETWLTALRRPPRTAGSLGAWLARVAGNLARDTQRDASRRRGREADVARPERVESVEDSHARLAAQREVVDVVLALEEPYKSVVLLRYYQDLRAPEIAERLGRSAATVRSQLSRAHELLRGSLDDEFEGGRRAWSVLLVPALPAANPIAQLWSGAAAKLAVAGASIAVLVVFVVPLLTEESAPELDGVAVLAAPESAGSEGLSPSFAPAHASAATETSTRQSIDSAATVPDPGQGVALEAKSLDELLALAVQTGRAIRRTLLTPDERFLTEQAALLAMPNTGVARLLNTEAHQQAIAVRGGGANYSFARKDHSYDAEPDLSFRSGRFKTGFYGIQIGLIMALGDVEIADLPTRGLPLPHWLDEEATDSWSVLWQDIAAEDAAHDSAFRQKNKALRRSIKPSKTPQSYLLRMHSPRQHDHLVAFRTLEVDELGCTIAWRILHTWPVPGDRQSGYVAPDPFADIPPAPEWIDALSLEEQLAFLAELREQAGSVLFEIPEDLRERYLSIVEQDAGSFAVKGGFVRILERGKWDPLVRVDGGGAYYSFQKRSHSYQEEPDLGLEQNRFKSGFYGGTRGFVLDLGEVPFEQLGAVMAGSMPAGLGEQGRESWKFLSEVRPASGDAARGRHGILSEADAEHAAALGLDGRTPAITGHSYLVRSIMLRQHDHLVVFTVIGEGEGGYTLAWRILHSWPVESSRRRR